MTTFLIAALTADGYIGRSADHTSTQWTSKEDAAFFQQKTKEAGVMIMGRTTFETIGRALSGRLIVVMTRNLKAEETTLDDAIAQKELDLPQVLSGPGQVVYTSHPPGEVLKRLQQAGAQQVAIAGGASIYTQFLAADLVDELFLTVEPMLFGDGVRLTNSTFPENKQLKLEETYQLSGQTTVHHFSCVRS